MHQSISNLKIQGYATNWKCDLVNMRRFADLSGIFVGRFLIVSDHYRNSVGITGNEDWDCSPGAIRAQNCIYGWVNSGDLIYFKPDLDGLCRNMDRPGRACFWTAALHHHYRNTIRLAAF